MDKQDGILEEEIAGLGVFVGDFVHSMDPKKRITIPSVWRVQITAPRSLYVLPDFYYRCLNVFPASAMAVKLEKIRRQSTTDKRAMQFARTLGAASDLVSWDSQGRIRIKDKLLEFAGLKDQVIMVGALDKFELWNPEYKSQVMKIDQEKLVEAGKYVDF